MERKKLLLVAVSVGVVLLIIIGIPLMIVSPRQNVSSTWQTVPQASVSAIRPKADQQAAIQNPVQVPWQLPGTGVAASPEAVPADGSQQPVAIQPPAETEQGGKTILTIPEPRSVGVPSATVTAAAAAPKPVAVAVKPAETTPANPAPVAARPAAARTAKPAASPAPRATTPAASTDSNFWVQAGAFSTKARAETVQESLETKGIASIIENRNVDGETFYRVRIGPYLSESEAKFWLSLVTEIGFSESQVRVTQVPASARN